ncbi:hypothetical protein AFLA_004478 [Aspergillus flavus NRRL3357]|nr:hypothetical protein AFLA_004478 [Aspergillus flavus NRRL3357]
MCISICLCVFRVVAPWVLMAKFSPRGTLDIHSRVFCRRLFRILYPDTTLTTRLRRIPSVPQPHASDAIM